MELDIDKLEDIFKKKYREMDSNGNEDFFLDWCDDNKIIMLHADWLVNALNEGGMRGRVCIASPGEGENVPPWLLVPKKLAERTLILGFLP